MSLLAADEQSGIAIHQIHYCLVIFGPSVKLAVALKDRSIF